MGSRRRVVAVVLAVLVLAAVVVVGRHVWSERHRTELTKALGYVPAETERLSFTDWTKVRKEFGVREDADPSEATITDMMGRAYDNDLSSVSSIDSAAVALQKYFGFSPATISWEAYAQSTAGSTTVLRVPDGFDLGKVRDDLERLKFTKPGDANGVWKGGIDLVAAIDPTITPQLQYVAVLADKHLVVTSNDEQYAGKAVKVALGRSDSLADVEAVRKVVAPVEDPAAAMVWTRDFACTDLSMSQADTDSQHQGDTLVQDAGKITPLSGLVMSLDPGRNLTVSELFESSRSAKENLTARARLVVGDAPGRGGSFSDDLELKSSSTKGATVQLRLAPKADTGFLLSALNSGPVLFATC